MNDFADRSLKDHDKDHEQNNTSSEATKDWSEVECVFRLKEFCRHSSVNLADSLVFRYACFHSFNFDVTRQAIKRNYSSRLLHLRMEGSLLDQLQERVFFPLPGLKTKDRRSEVLYFRQSRYLRVLSKESHQGFIDNICYVLNDMSRSEEQCRNGVLLIANMKGYDVKNHDDEGMTQFAHAIQGKLVPTRVKLILIVGATSEEKTWKYLKPLLSPTYAKKVQFINEDQLGDYLMEGCDLYLPDEFRRLGCKDCQELVEDYMDLKIYQEQSLEAR